MNENISLLEIIKKSKCEAFNEFNARIYSYRTGIHIKGEELIIIPMSDYEQILKELTNNNDKVH